MVPTGYFKWLQSKESTITACSLTHPNSHFHYNIYTQLNSPNCYVAFLHTLLPESSPYQTQLTQLAQHIQSAWLTLKARLTSAISFIEKNVVFLTISKRCKISDFLGIKEYNLTPIFKLWCIVSLVFLSTYPINYVFLSIRTKNNLSVLLFTIHMLLSRVEAILHIGRCLKLVPLVTT